MRVPARRRSKGALQRARAAVGARPPAADRERAPRPNSALERQLVARFAEAVESGDVDDIVALLTDDALLTMPPQPLEYQGHDAIASFLSHRAELRGAALRVVPTRANTQPAFGCYLPDAQCAIARAYGLIVLTLHGDAVAAITWFADTGVFRHFGLPRTLRS
jgi:RNA polymerase sigma-70 factor (ECF subfamily)